MKYQRYYGAFAVAALWLVLAAAAWFSPNREISEAERRRLAVFPDVNTEAVLSGKFMSGFETYTQDQFPLRDRFRQLKAVFSYQVLHRGDNNGIYLAQGSAAKLEYPLKASSVAGAQRKFNEIYDTWLKDHSGRIVFSIAPDKGYYLAAANGYPAMDYAALTEAMASLPWAEFVDITDCLDADGYYTTDTHWRQECLLPAARKLAQALEIQIPEDYRITELERPFYGVYYGQAALPMAPDTIRLLESDVLDGCTVYNHENGTTASVYDRSKLTSRDLYDVFLSGPVSVLTVENPAGEQGRELVVFRDSFGSSLIPLLLPAYEKVTILDIRYVPTAYLGQFVDFHGQDILLLYSPLVLNNSIMLK